MDRFVPSTFYYRNFREYRRRDASSRIPAHDLLSRDASKLKIEYDILEQCLHQDDSIDEMQNSDDDDYDTGNDSEKESKNQFYMYAYQLDILTENCDDLDDELIHLKRQLRDKNRAFELLSRDYEKLQKEYEYLELCFNQRNQLLDANGLAAIDIGSVTEQISSSSSTVYNACPESAILTSGNGNTNNNNNNSVSGSGGIDCESATKTIYDDLCTTSAEWDDGSESGISGIESTFDHHTSLNESIECILGDVVGTNLNEKIENAVKERNDLIDEVQDLKEELNNERDFNYKTENLFITNHCSNENNYNEKVVIEYRRALDTAECEVEKLTNNLEKLEIILEKYRLQVEQAEMKEKEALEKKRKALRQYREAEARIDELEGINSLLHKKIAKLKTSKLSS